MRPHDATLALPPYARLLLPVLKRLAKGHPECWSSNETLAKAVGCCVKTIRNALAALEAAGLVRRVRDYHLRSRRRIVLLWVEARGFFGFMTADTSRDSTPDFAASSSLPPDPPIKGPEGESLRSDGERGAIEAPPEAPPPPDLAPLVEKAKALAPADPAPESRIRGLARRWPAAWIGAALDRLAAKAGREKVGSPFGYVRNTLVGFEAEGGPPPVPVDPAAERARVEADFMARLLARRAAHAEGVPRDDG